MFLNKSTKIVVCLLDYLMVWVVGFEKGFEIYFNILIFWF